MGFYDATGNIQNAVASVHQTIRDQGSWFAREVGCAEQRALDMQAQLNAMQQEQQEIKDTLQKLLQLQQQQGEYYR